jgi:hypothetical protein
LRINSAASPNSGIKSAEQRNFSAEQENSSGIPHVPVLGLQRRRYRRTAADYLAPGIGTVVPACDLPSPVLAPPSKVPAFNHRQQWTAFKSDTGRSA